MLGSNDEADSSHDEVAAPVQKTTSSSQGKNDTKNKKAAKQDNASIDAILAELDLDTAPTPTSKKKNKKSKKKTDELVAEPTATVVVASPIHNEIDELLAEPATPTDSATEPSKKKKKPKKKKEAAAPVPAPAPKPSAAILALKQRQEAQKRAEEEFKRQEDERIRLEEEEIRREQEEADRKEADRQRRIEEKRREKDELRRQGKLMTKGQKAKADKAAAYLEQMRAQGLVPPERPDKPATGAKPKPKRKVKKLTQKEKMLAELKAGAPQQDEEVVVDAEPERPPSPKREQAEVIAEPEPAPSPENRVSDDKQASEDDTSEQSSGSVVAAWDMDSDENDRLRREKDDRRAKRLKARAHRERQRRIREQEKREREEQEQALLEQKMAEAATASSKQIEPKPLAKKPAKHESDSSSESSADDAQPLMSKEDQLKAQSKIDSRLRREKRKESAMAERTSAKLRSPICCILGHVDTGKTKILDQIRQTKVQAGEAGGITQQIGASFFPVDAIVEKTKDLNALQKKQLEYRLPGLLIIDTPGHESFTNLRSRGSSLCDIAVLVVDIMHGLEPQTLESLRLLMSRKTPFIVALNKIDRIYDWKPQQWAPFATTFAAQPEHSKSEFEERVKSTIVAFAEQGLNCALYFRNPDFRKTVSLVPTSAITGEGLPDLLAFLVQLSQNMMNERLQYISELQCTVLEVKVVDGIGTTIDVILSNGYLHVNDTIVVCGLQGPIVATVRALLTPYPMTELRVKGEYQRLKTVQAAAGIKISASGLEDAVAGSQLLVAGPGDDIEDLKDEVMTDLASILSKVDKSGRGVCVQSSTLGSLEALLQFLSDSKIPVSGIAIGPVHKKDIIRASAMLEKQPEYAAILAFDVKVTSEARQHAQDRGVRIFTADIIYHLFDQFTAYIKEIETANQAEVENIVIMPCILEIIKEYVFRMKDPIIIGVNIKEGILRKGTPLCCHDRGDVVIGEVSGIELNHKDINEAKAGQQVCIKIEPKVGHLACTYGRQFDHTNQLQSKITRRSIDILKASFKDYLSQDDWKCVIKLKKMFDII